MIRLRQSYFLVIQLLMIFCFFNWGFGEQKSAPVALVLGTDSSFILQTGDYRVEFGVSSTGRSGRSRRRSNSKEWLTIYHRDIENQAIGTKLANGLDLYPTDNNILQSIQYDTTGDAITIHLKSRQYWGEFESVLIAYKKYPGMLHWKVDVSATADKVFDGSKWELRDPDCFFMASGQTTMHRVYRYLVPRGPVGGMLFFHDLDMKSSILYFEDYSSLNKLYELTNCANPYNVDRELNPSAVTMGYPWGEFQSADSAGRNSIPPNPWKVKEERFGKFGYQRPENYRITKGTQVTIADTYLYLSPAFEEKTPELCFLFTRMLAEVYTYIYKPPLVHTDWSGTVAPGLIHELLTKDKYWSNHNGKPYLKAYVNFKENDAQLITQTDILNPLTAYIKKYPGNKEALELKKKLELGLSSYFDESTKGISNGFELPPDNFYSSWYQLFQTLNVADLALEGNNEAVQMLQGSRQRLLDMGKACNYVFANVNTSTFQQKGFYNFEVTGEYAYIMMALYQLSGKKDKESLAAAKDSIERLMERGFDLTYELNGAMAGAVAAYQLYQETGNPKYRDIAYIPLANTLRWAWLWECDYGVGKHVQTFWGFCPTPSNQNQAEHESHHTRRFLRQFYQLAKNDFPDEVQKMLRDSWIYGQGQSRYTLPPYLVESGAAWSMVKEGPSETLCGEIDYHSWVCLEDVHAGWCTDSQWYMPNPKNGVVGQEIYGAGGPLWYALWEEDWKGIK